MLSLRSISKKIVGTFIYTFSLFTATCWLTTGCHHTIGFDDKGPKDADAETDSNNEEETMNLSMKACYAILMDQEETHEDIINISEEQADGLLKGRARNNRKRYLTLCTRYHPDKFYSQSEEDQQKATEKTQRLNSAKERLEQEKGRLLEGENGYWP